MEIVVSRAAATDGTGSRRVITMRGSDFVRFGATFCQGCIAGNNPEQNDRQNPPFIGLRPERIEQQNDLALCNVIILQ
jgi:hypothetical protein